MQKYRKDRDRCHRTGEYWGAAHSICSLKYSVPKEILILFNNGSNYDYHFKGAVRKAWGTIYLFRRKSENT